MAFGESLALLVGDERTVIPGWFGKAERATYQYLSSCGLKQIGTANNFGNRHRSIVDGDSELISRHSVFAPHEEISKVFPGHKSLWSKMAVVKFNGPAIWNAESPVDAFLGGRLSNAEAS